MKKFLVFFMIFAIVLSLVGTLAVAVNADEPEIRSGYYSIDREAGLIGQISPNTDAATVLSRVLASGKLSLSAGVSTGSLLTLTQGEEVVDQLTLVVLSDCSGDGVFSVTDMLMVKARLLNQNTFTPAQSKAADVSGDNAVTITDFLQMKSKILGMTDFSPRPLPNVPRENTRILTIGEVCSFGPADGFLLPPEDPAAPVEEPTGETEPSEKGVAVEGDAVTWEAGTVTAVKLGTALLTCGEERLMVTVCSEGWRISLPQNTLFVGPGSSAQLQAAVNHPLVPSALTYKTEDPAVAKVDSQGVLTGVATGTTKVTVSLPDGTSASQDVRVIQLIDTVTLDKDYIKIRPGKTRQLQVSVEPLDSTEKLFWTSSDPAIATVDDQGVVTGVDYGTVTISCYTQYGKIRANCKVKICDVIQVALTFDDGPSTKYTDKLLDALKKYDVKATFFLVGNRISWCPSTVKRIGDEGHEYGYHTWAHEYFFNMNADDMRRDIAKFENALMSAAGAKPTVYRAPGGSLTDTALETYDMPHILWTFDTIDWKTRDAKAVRDAILRGLKDGYIILMHDIHGTTVDGAISALNYIISQDMDVEFVTVTELLSRNGQPPKPGHTYNKG